MSLDDDPFLSDDGIHLGDVIAKLWPRRWLILGSAVLVTAIFIVVAFVIDPVYRATTVMVPATNEHSGANSLGGALGSLGGLASLAGINIGGSSAQVEEALAVLRSRDFTERFIREKDILPVLFHRRWDASKNRWGVPDKRIPTLADGSRYFQKRVRSVTHDKKTGLITLNIEWHDPDTAAAWANELVARLNEEMRRRAINSTTASLEYLQKELIATTVVDTRQAINRLMETQINQRMFANVTKEYAFRVVDRALPPDLNDEVRPNKPMLAAIGLLLGLVIGAGVALVQDAYRRKSALQKRSAA